MSFERKKFLGLTVVDFSASTGWNDSETSLTIKMAEDKDHNDVLVSHPLGTKIDFQMGSFKFAGFLDRLTERHDGGGVTYEAKVNDGKEILRNVECITKFYGTVATDEDSPIDNLLNIFRYYEAQKFGDSQTDDTGMPYHIFQAGVNYLSARDGIWSAGKKFSIKLDFSLPEYYRMPVPHVNLLDAISQICDDLGLLYRIELVNDQFVIKTASLAVDPANQKVIDAIKTKANADENIISWETGIESANSVESNFLIWGGQKEQTFIFADNGSGAAHSAKYFWGYDRNGKPYWSSTSVVYGADTCPFFGASITYPIFKTGYPTGGSGLKSIAIPIPGLEDVINSNGGLFYELDLIEAVIILGGNQDTWELYLEIREDQGFNYAYGQIYLRPPRLNIKNVSNFMIFGGTNENPVKRVFAADNDDVGIIRGTRVFAYLKSVLEGSMGKKILWPIDEEGIKTLTGHDPLSKVYGLLINQKLESYISADGLDVNSPDGNPKKIYNITPTESGWCDTTKLKSLCPKMPQEIFDGEILGADGKTGNFMIIPTGGLPTVGNDPKNSFFSDPVSGDLWVKVSVDPEFIYIDNIPYVLISSSQNISIFNKNQQNEVGYYAITNCFFGVKDRNSIFGQSLNVSTGALPIGPSTFILNFKSNRNDFYGPWYVGKKGSGGKTKVEQDTNLVPWAFNSSSKLEEVAQKKLKDISPISSFETGSFTRVGLPELGLGEELTKGGPKLTSINATYGVSGVTTQCTFRTFTSKFGLPSRYMLERMKKTALKAYSDRKNILGLFNEAKRKNQSLALRQAGWGAGGIADYFLNFLGRKNDRNSPHGHILMTQIGVNRNYASTFGANGGTNAEVKILGITAKNNEVSAALRKQSVNLKTPTNKGAASLDALFSPFSNFTNENRSASNFPSVLTSRTYEPLCKFNDKTMATSITLNPFQLNSYIGSFLSDDGDRYCNWSGTTAPRTFQRTTELGGSTGVIKSNAIALRGPLMISGWGQNLYYPKTIVPNNDKGILHPGRTAEAVTGPLDLMYDDIRGVWTSHGTLVGKSMGMIKKSGFVENKDIPVGSNSNDYFPSGTMKPAGSFSVHPDGEQFNYFSGHDIKVVNVGKTIGPNQPIVAHLNQHTGEWWFQGQGCGIRYDNNECGSDPETTSSEALALEALNRDFKIFRDISGDLGNCVARNKVADFTCFDLLQTNGFTGTVVYLKTKAGETGELRFKNGLFKEVITTTIAPPPPSTTTPSPTSTTTSNTSTTPEPLYYLNESTDDPDCFICSQTETANTISNHPTLPDCETAKLLANVNCKVELYFDGTCWQCRNSSIGAYFGPTKMEDCKVDQNNYNIELPECGNCYLIEYDHTPQAECYRCGQSLPTSPDTLKDTFTGPTSCDDCANVLPSYNVNCATTTTTTPCPTMYLHKNENDDCHYCSQEEQGNMGVYYESLIDGVCSTTCETEKLRLDEANPACQLCYNIVGDCSSSTCYSCAECPVGETGQYSSKEPCDTEAARLNAACSPPCVTTTTTTADPNCVEVVTSVECDPNTGVFTYTKVNVQKCSTGPIAQKLPDFEYILLKAKVESLTQQLSNLYNMLELYGINITGEPLCQLSRLQQQ